MKSFELKKAVQFEDGTRVTEGDTVAIKIDKKSDLVPFFNPNGEFVKICNIGQEGFWTEKDLYISFESIISIGIISYANT